MMRQDETILKTFYFVNKKELFYKKIKTNLYAIWT